MLKKNDFLELKIERYAFGGNGIGFINDERGKYTVFVENTIPGQFVKAQITKADKRLLKCKLIDTIYKSEEEVNIPFFPIPGAPYATWPIELQQKNKKDGCLELYKRIGKIENVASLFDAFISSPLIWNYRNKMEYSFGAIRYDLDTKQELDEFALGFKHRGTWWMVENLNSESGLFDSHWENNLIRIREFCEQSGLPPWHAPKRTGFFRYIVVRKSFSEDKLLINLVTSSSHLNEFNLDKFKELVLHILGNRCAGIIHTINDDTGDRSEPLKGSSSLIYGQEEMSEVLLELSFQMNMKSFFQTNPKSAELLYNKAIEYCAFENNEGTVLDLFCGTGTIGQLIAKRTGLPIVGVDIIEEAIEDARINAAKNQISNARFIAADVGKFLLKNPEYTNQIQTLVLDPPRGGIAPKTLRKVIALNAKRMVYISCNPATQARDCETLSAAGYELKKLSFVDQFPHTSHLEAIAFFEKK